MSTLSESDRELILRVADVLIPPNATMPGLRAADPDRGMAVAGMPGTCRSPRRPDRRPQ